MDKRDSLAGGRGTNRSSSPPPSSDRGKRKGLLKEKLHLEKFKGADGTWRWTIQAIDEQLSFDKGFYVFIRALQLLKAHNDGVVLVGLAGASGSGKTAFSERVKSFMPGIAVISMDNYNDASKLIDSNFDDPRLTDYELLMANLAELRAGRPAEIPIYDFKASRRSGFQTLPVPASRIVVIEGIYALSEKLRPLLDLRVSITGGVHFDLVKRVMRDITRSGQGPEEIIQQITDTVYPMYKAFIEPDLKMAQLRIYNSFNPFAGLMDAAHILKSRRTPDITEEAVAAALGPGAPPPRREEMCDIHLLPPNEDPETCQSWLRMRNRDGRYTLMFEEWVTEGPFIISPRITFEVSVRVLGGLMALGYEIGTIMRRRTVIYRSADEELNVKLDEIENLGEFIQVHSKDRERCSATAKALGMREFIPHSYIEQVQLDKLTTEFQDFNDDIRKRFSVTGADSLFGDSLFEEASSGYGGYVLGTSPRGGLSLMSPTGGLLTSPLSGARRSAAAARGGRGGGGGSGGGGGGGGGVALPPPLLSSSAPVAGVSALAAAAAAAAVPISIPTLGSGGGRSGGDAGSEAGSTDGAAAGGGVIRRGSSGILEGVEFGIESPGAAGGRDTPTLSAAGPGPGSERGVAWGAAGGGGGGGGGAAAASNGGRAGGRQAGGLLGEQLRLSAASGGGGGGGGTGGGGGSEYGGGGAGDARQASLAGVAARGASSSGHALSRRGGGGGGPGSEHGGGEGRGGGGNGGGNGRGETDRREGRDGRDGRGGGGEGGGSVPVRVQQQLDVLGEGVRRYSGVSLQLDAMIHHQKALNEGVAALTAVAEELRRTLSDQQQQQGAAAASSGSSGGGGNSGVLAGAGPAALMGAGAACAALGVGLGLLLARR